MLNLGAAEGDYPVTRSRLGMTRGGALPSPQYESDGATSEAPGQP